MARLIYGAGLRLQECLSLRVKDIDFETNVLTVKPGKGDKDRLTILPENLKPDLDYHLKEVRKLYEVDRQNDEAGVFLPNALERKYPNAGKEWGWQWVTSYLPRTIDATILISSNWSFGDKKRAGVWIETCCRFIPIRIQALPALAALSAPQLTICKLSLASSLPPEDHLECKNGIRVPGVG